jgi:hypothetical protein
MKRRELVKANGALSVDGAELTAKVRAYIIMKTTLLILIAMASVVNAQIGWTLDQCRKQWGHETSIEH